MADASELGGLRAMETFDVEVAVQDSEWDRFLSSSRSEIGYVQFSWWADFLVTQGWGDFEVVVKQRGTILGGARVLSYGFAPGKCFYYVPEGPVLPEDEALAERVFEAIMAFIEEEREAEPDVVSHLRFEPRWARRPSFMGGCDVGPGWLEPRRTLCIDLSLSEDALLEQMKPKGRYNIRLAHRKGVRVVEDTSPRGVADFVALYHEAFERHDLDAHSDSFFVPLAAYLSACDVGSILFAEYENTRLAAAVVIFSGDRATYRYGGSSRSHRGVMAPYLLHFEAMRRAKVRGHRWYDLYGVSAQDEPDDPWTGFSVFKRKFGGCELSFIPPLDRVFDRDAYREYFDQDDLGDI